MVFFQNLINALQWGSFYALIALGYSMVYSILMLFNFAHGDIFMVGAYISFFLAGFLLGFFRVGDGRPAGMAVTVTAVGAGDQIVVAQHRHGYSNPEIIVGPTPVKPPVATPTPRPAPPPGARGRMAILLDDAGQQIQLVSQATSLPREVGVAVLPFLLYSI